MKLESNSGFWPEESVSQRGGGGDVRAETPFAHWRTEVILSQASFTKIHICLGLYYAPKYLKVIS